MTPFETKTKLLPHQKDAVAKVLPSKVSALFMDMGTGKSRTAIEVVHQKAERIDRVIWCCPVALKDTVRYEIAKHTDCGDVYVFNPKTTAQTVDRNARWIVVGIESLSSSSRVTVALASIITDRTMVIVDESSYIKGHKSLRTMRITKLAESARYRMILTGTPISQGIIDLYSQMYFLSPKILGYRSWYSFERNHLEYSDKFPGMIVKTHNVGYLAEKIKPYTYQVTKEECLDLPEKLYETRGAYLTDAQREAYEQAKEEILQDLFDDDFGSITIFRLFTALQSIVCGFWTRLLTPVRDLRDRLTIKRTEFLEYPERRTDALLSVVSMIPRDEKIVVWGKFRYSIDRIAGHLSEQYGPDSVALFHGGINEKARSAEVEKFRTSARFFLATQSCGGHGLTLNEAHHVIFYANGFKYSERMQAEDRTHRIGQEHDCTYIDIHAPDTIDGRIETALATKGNALKQFRAEVDKIRKKGTKAKLRELVKNL